MKLTIIGVILLVVAIAILLHQFMVYNIWFEFDDLHHETWMIMFGFCGVVLLLIGRGK